MSGSPSSSGEEISERLRRRGHDCNPFWFRNASGGPIARAPSSSSASTHPYAVPGRRESRPRVHPWYWDEQQRPRDTSPDPERLSELDIRATVETVLADFYPNVDENNADDYNDDMRAIEEYLSTYSPSTTGLENAESPLQRAISDWTRTHNITARNQAPVSHAATAAAMPRSERNRLIRELQEKDNKSPAPAMSRSCRVCFTDSPNQRAVFTACGHAVCRPCALKVAGEANDKGKKLTCPFCRAETDFVPLFEDPVAEIKN